MNLGEKRVPRPTTVQVAFLPDWFDDVGAAC